MNRIVLGVLGRGSQFLTEDSVDMLSTPDLEIGDDNPDRKQRVGHLVYAKPTDDNNPFSKIGGGELNLLAARELYKKLDPEIAVFAYGNMSKYLKDSGYPSESELIAREFEKRLAKDNIQPRVDIFYEGQWGVKEAGTNQEVHNIMHLAVERGISDVVLVTVTVHSERTALMTLKHRLQDPLFEGLSVRIEKSELVLWQADPAQYTERIRTMFGSLSYVRTVDDENFGTNRVLQVQQRYVPVTS